MDADSNWTELDSANTTDSPNGLRDSIDIADETSAPWGPVPIERRGSIRFVHLDGSTVALIIGKPRADGPIAVIDVDDLDCVVAVDAALEVSSRGYVTYRRSSVGNQMLHRHLLGLKPGSRSICDHKNGDQMDNRRRNIRKTNRTVNQRNRRKCTTPTTCRAIGVCYDRKYRHYVAYISPGYGRPREFMRGFLTEADALRARDERAAELGWFTLNQPRSGADDVCTGSAHHRGDPALLVKVARLRANLEIGWYFDGYIIGYDDV